MALELTDTIFNLGQATEFPSTNFYTLSSCFPWRARLLPKIDLLQVPEESQKLRKQLHDGLIRIIQSHPVLCLDVEICYHSEALDDGARGAHGIGNMLQHSLVKLGF